MTAPSRRCAGFAFAPLFFAILALAAVGCAKFDPKPLKEIPFLERAESQSRDGLRVVVAVLDARESKQAFGVDLAKKKIQPVWIEIENESDVPYVLMRTAVDPAYFSAREAAYRNHMRLRANTNERMDDFFSDQAIDAYVPPHESREGFVFTNLKLGTKEVRVRLLGPQRLETFEFYVSVPGFRADWHEVDWDELADRPFTELPDEAALRAALTALPCCTTRANGSGEGDPLNLVFIGSGREIGNALIRAGWDETETLSFASGWRTFKAFFGGTYKYSPMSSLYLFDRSQDAGFQKARDTIHERNHLRLWLSPYFFGGKPVWVGSITRDIGVYFTRRTWNLTTHAIDPDVDEARSYIREDFQVAESVERWGFVVGVGAATPERPHRNLMNAPWWTDGLRLVMDFPDERTVIPLVEQRFFHWEWPDDDPDLLNEGLKALGD